MSNTRKIVWAASVALLAWSLTWRPAMGAKKYDPGASDKEIKIGQTMPYSGPASSYATIGRVEAAYFQKINDEGGVNGRKLKLISVDDGYSPARTVEMTRKLVEQDEVLLTFQQLGTAPNAAIQKYLNGKKVPQLFVASGATRWNDPKGNPWTMGWQPNYQAEARIYARQILQTKPDAKIAVLLQNDDYGRDYLKGFKDGLGDKAATMIAAEASYEVTDPTIDSQIIALKASGADVFFNIATPKFAAQAIRKAYDTGWKPLQYLNAVSASVGAVLAPAGLDKSAGIISSTYLKDPSDKECADDPGIKEWIAFMKKYYPDGSQTDYLNVFGYAAAQTLVYVLQQCGDDVSRENVIKQAANLKDLKLGVLLPGITINTTPTRFEPIRSLQLQRFDGKQWVRFGDRIDQ